MDASTTEGRRRRTWSVFGPTHGLDVIAIALPPLTALALRGDAWSSWAAAHLMAMYGGPFLALVLFGLGLGPNLLVRYHEATRAELFRASAIRAALAVVAGVGSIWLIVPPDLSHPLGPMWLMLAWLGGLGLPLWANALFLRLEGALTIATFVRALAVGVLSAGGALAAGLLLTLPLSGMVVPVAVGGTVYTSGVAVAAWRDVSGPDDAHPRRWMDVVAVTAAISVAVSLTMATRIANPPLDTLEVDGIMAFDVASQRLAFGIVRRASQLHSIGELDLETGEWVEFGRRDMQVTYADGRRVVARRSRTSYTLDTHGAATLCRETADAGADCGPAIEPGRGLLVRGHQRKPLVLASRESRLLVWDVVTGETWRVHRPGGRIRWACFAGGPSLYWRVQRDQPPYDQELLRLTDDGGEPEQLGLVHEHGCDDDGAVDRVGRFDRGRSAAGQLPSIRGPGLPEGGVELDEAIHTTHWSGDGGTLGIMDKEGGVRFYRPDLGLTEFQPTEARGAIRLSADGKLMANMYGGGGGKRFSVRTVPDFEPVLLGARRDSDVWWDASGRLVLMRRGQIVRLDPTTGDVEVLFPPPRAE